MTASRPSRGAAPHFAPERPPLEAGRLSVAITSPYVWPWVRRGSERMLHDFSRYLLDRGHHVTVYSTGPEDATEDRDGITYHLLRQRLNTKFRLFNGCHDFAFRLPRVLEGFDGDVVFCMNLFDAYAALRTRDRVGGRYKVIFHSAGILSKRYFRAVPFDSWFFRKIRRDADLAIATSQYAGEVFKRDFGRDVMVVPPPVNTEQFTPGADDAIASGPGPRLLFVGDAEERRKGARVLCRALPLVREHFPDVRLVYAGRISEATEAGLLAEARRSGMADRVEFLGVGRIEDLPRLYRSASVTVLPALDEAFGMALVESLAAGTPVVGTRRGGMADIIEGDVIGRLFETGTNQGEADNVEGLAEAIVAVLSRGKTPEVIAACRARAEKFSWKALGPIYENTLLSIAGHATEPDSARHAAMPASGDLLVSVVIPTHDRKELLARLLASLEKQTLDPSLYEVHIVHNYTPDGTEELARAWCARQPFRAFYYRKNYDGPTRSRTFGASESKGRFIAFIDDDCVATPGWLESGTAAFASVAAGEGAGAGLGIGLVQGRTMPEPGPQPRFLVRTIRVEKPTIFYETCNIFYRRSAFEDVGGFSEDFMDQFSGEDTDLGWKMTERGYKAAFAPDALAHHAVFRVSYGQWLAEPLLLLKNLPYMAKKYPGFRARLFHPYFFSKDTCLFNVFLLGLLVAAVSPLAGGLIALPYLVERYRNGVHVGGPGVRLARVIFGLPRGFTMWWALLMGSIQARTLLL